MINELTIRRVEDAANILDVMTELGFDLKPKQGGKEYECLCPFHEDRHLGSFFVNPRKNIYHCFSCNAHGGPVNFLIEHEKMTFPDAIRWLGRMYGVEVEGSERFAVSKRQPHQPPPPLPMLTLNYDYIKHYQQNLDQDILVQWLYSLPWDSAQRARIPQMLKNYLVGTTHDNGDFTIFWQVDEQGRVRSGKMLKYRTNGHRRKDVKYNSDWIHSRLRRAGMYDDSKVEFRSTYFGMHLTGLCPDADINIVESEKTALIMAIAYGDMKRSLWIACGGKGYINREKMKPLIDTGRHIVLYPDRDGVEEWKQLASMIGYKHLTVNSNYLNKYWKPEDGEKADIADLMVRWLHESAARRQKSEAKPKQSVLDQMIAANPNLITLINKFDLIER